MEACSTMRRSLMFASKPLQEKSFLLSVTSISLRENSVVQRQRLIKEMVIGIFLFNFDFKF